MTAAEGALTVFTARKIITMEPSLPAVLTQFPFIAPDDWSLPTGEFPGAAEGRRHLGYGV